MLMSAYIRISRRFSSAIAFFITDETAVHSAVLRPPRVKSGWSSRAHGTSQQQSYRPPSSTARPGSGSQ